MLLNETGGRVEGTANPQVVWKYLPPAKALEFETNAIRFKIILLKFIFSVLAILQLNQNVIIRMDSPCMCTLSEKFKSGR